MGGRGSDSGGPGLGGGKEKDIKILNPVDVWSYRHRQGNEPFVDAINEGVRTVADDFPTVMNDLNFVNTATFGGRDGAMVLGVYSPSDKQLAMAKKYTEVDRMNQVYDRGGNFHPSRGDKTAVQAVTMHEMGHAVNDHLAAKMGTDMDSAAKTIVDNAYKNSKGKGGTKAWAGKISGYAQESNAECIAEAMCDWYCNGSNAKSQSKAIMSELKRVYKS